MARSSPAVPNDPQKLGRPILDLSGTVATADHIRRRRRHAGNHASRRRRRLGNGACVAKPARRGRRDPDRERCACELALDHRAHRHALGYDGFVVLILGFAFHWQATRGREADLIHDTVRCRIDTALNRGRCGLWDWDLARGRVFWSRSMFDILGLPARDDLLTFGELNALVHGGDIDLYALARQLADAEVQSIDHAFRMRHADGHWLWLRVRCELARQDGEAGLHVIGIAVDVSEQKNLVERRTLPTCGCATLSRPFPKPSSCGTPTIAWCCAIRISRSCTACPTRRSWRRARL